MYGFCVNHKDFKKESLSSTKGPQPANVPEGVADASEIAINYMYPTDEKEVESRLIIECPTFKTQRGIEPPKVFAGGSGKGKPAIATIFDLEDPDQKNFVGSFGNKHEYKKVKGSVERVHKDYIEPSGILGSIYDWCVEQYAKYLILQDDPESTEDPGLLEYREASNKINIKDFIYFRRHKDGEFKDQIVEGANPLKFFKLLSYAVGTPEENSAKFYLPDGTRIDNKTLYGKSFSYTPFISFRRIFISEKVSVTIDLIEAVIVDFFESTHGISARSSRLIQHMKASDPEQAAVIAEKYRLLIDGDVEPETTGVNVEPVDINAIDGEVVEETNFVEVPDIDVPVSSSRRPKLPKSSRGKTIDDNE